MLDGVAVKQRAVFLADLATTYVQDGEVDKGCEVAGEAAVTLSKAGYATSAERLHDFRGPPPGRWTPGLCGRGRW